jgi:ABC-type antimicrobial peptide transport system permease subunit
MEERLDRSLVPRRLPMLLGVMFGLTALVLAAVGVYGVLAHRASLRQREIGIRLALGSSIEQVFWLVARDGVRITVAGLALGALGVIAVTRALARLLYGVSSLDPVVIAAAVAVLVVVSVVATLIPARHAAKADPVTMLTE